MFKVFSVVDLNITFKNAHQVPDVCCVNLAAEAAFSDANRKSFIDQTVSFQLSFSRLCRQLEFHHLWAASCEECNSQIGTYQYFLVSVRLVLHIIPMWLHISHIFASVKSVFCCPIIFKLCVLYFFLILSFHASLHLSLGLTNSMRKIPGRDLFFNVTSIFMI